MISAIKRDWPRMLLGLLNAMLGLVIMENPDYLDNRVAHYMTTNWLDDFSVGQAFLIVGVLAVAFAFTRLKWCRAVTLLAGGGVQAAFIFAFGFRYFDGSINMTWVYALFAFLLTCIVAGLGDKTIEGHQ
ncbi:hypothetical protein [Lacticaseibacillus brantae]|nr:hypothetical protein [Lacticaseibacillus brantae]